MPGYLEISFNMSKLQLNGQIVEASEAPAAVQKHVAALYFIQSLRFPLTGIQGNALFCHGNMRHSVPVRHAPIAHRLQLRQY
jgi:hypothetical protein